MCAEGCERAGGGGRWPPEFVLVQRIAVEFLAPPNPPCCQSREWASRGQNWISSPYASYDTYSLFSVVCGVVGWFEMDFGWFGRLWRL